MGETGRDPEGEGGRRPGFVWRGVDVAPAGSRRRARRDRPRPRVLVVDDDADMRRAVSAVLAEACEVVALPDAKDLAAACSVHRPAALVLDVHLGDGPDGLEACRRLRADGRWSRLPVLFLTGAPENDVFSRLLDAAGDAYLSKPFEPDELVETLLRLLDA